MAVGQRRLVLLAGGAPWAERATSAALAAWPRRGRGPRLLRADLRDPPVKALGGFWRLFLRMEDEDSD